MTKPLTPMLLVVKFIVMTIQHGKRSLHTLRQHDIPNLLASAVVSRSPAASGQAHVRCVQRDLHDNY